ncbi:hypothetical protein JMF97_12790 [Micromonospora fiedleri]|uniref:Uncharacterized protein n=1 Tax=Micromonospora fiedleri TaxID=1157498 RepID=A0ABS1UL40_9ACTN|nr:MULTISPECIES: hypothetical protein [Micromonospora]MBL6277037.1 hypothetical protein [Micromonospora fiedleri]WSK43259.1 hypothetical protein OG712_03590 [Micromonospora maris]
MARQGWGGSIATAAGVAAGAGAAQLGFGYGLGILNWAPAEPTAGTAAWVASLIWATWIAATSTIFGAVCAQRLRDRRPALSTSDAESAADPGRPPVTDGRGGDGLWFLALAGAAALGALITVLLVAVPARVAVVPDTPSPRDMAAGYAAVGVLVGTLVALWSLRCRAAATNVIATAGWLWLLAVVAVLDSVLAGRGLTTAQLGIWQLSSDSDQFWIRDYFYWPGAILSLGSALVIGALAARRGVRDADRRVGATASGAAGPLLVAIAYFLAVPRLTAINPEQVSAHLIAPYAAIVGVGGSVLVAALAQRSARRRSQQPATDAAPTPLVPRQRPADHDSTDAPTNGDPGGAVVPTRGGRHSTDIPTSGDQGGTYPPASGDRGSADTPASGDPVGSGTGESTRRSTTEPSAGQASEVISAEARSGTDAGRAEAGGRSGASRAEGDSGTDAEPATGATAGPEASSRRARPPRRAR